MMNEELGLENVDNQPEEKRFTQSELNKFLADDRRKTERKYATRAKDMQLTHDLERAAMGSDCISPTIIVSMLKSMSKVVERTDEAGGIGIYDTVIDLPDEDEDGGSIVTRCSAKEAIKRMKDLKDFQGFFKSNVASGIGGSANQQPTRQLDPSKMSTEQYMELRSTPQGKKRLGLNNIARR